MKPIYVDHGATTPLLKEALEEALPFLKSSYGNPSSMHPYGISVKKRINDEREKLANVFHVSPKTLYFTSGATESINLVLQGVSAHFKHQKKIISTRIEHKATLNTLHHLESLGVEVIYLDLDQSGLFSFEQFESLLSSDIGLVSLMWANNEIGTLYDVKRITEICHRHQVLLHIDGVCVASKFDINLSELKIDYLSLSAHKFYGPKGAGLLYIKENAPMEPMIFGGSQEKGLRAGTENVFGIIGLSTAYLHMHQRLSETVLHLNRLTKRLRDGLKDLEEVRFQGPNAEKDQLPGLVSLGIKGFQSMDLSFELIKEGIYASTGSACNSDIIEDSHVIRALYFKSSESYGIVRFTFGFENTLEEVDRIIAVVREIIIDNR